MKLGFAPRSVWSFLIDRSSRVAVRCHRTVEIETLAWSRADGPKERWPWAAGRVYVPRASVAQVNGPWAENLKPWYGPRVLIRGFSLVFCFSEACFRCFLSFLGNFHLVFSYAKIVQRNYCVGNRKVKEMLLKSKKIIELLSIVFRCK